jgi:uncharacterized protein
MWFFDPMYLLFVSPALLLMLWAQAKVKSSYGQGMKVDARLTGAAAARYVLDRAGLNDVGIEEARGFLSDHYDPSHRVLRLSHEVYHTRTATAVGIAAHEAGHAIQHASGYMPLVIRNAAVPAARFGPALFFALFIAGAIFGSMQLMVLGLAAFGGVLFFQVVNLPVEFDASNRAKALLTEYNIVDGDGAIAVRRVLNAAGWTYVAATLQTLLQFLYYAFQILGASSDD